MEDTSAPGVAVAASSTVGATAPPIVTRTWFDAGRGQVGRLRNPLGRVGDVVSRSHGPPPGLPSRRAAPPFFVRRRSPMAVMNLQSLVLRGVNVAGDVVTGRERLGFNPAKGGTPAVVLSFQRHLSTRAPQAGSDPRPCHE